eukprot:1477478-Prymnesium_polylepis.1
MLTSSAIKARRCSASSPMSSTQPVSASLRHISNGSHQNADRWESAERKAIARLRGVDRLA